jgi:hypothetical protein
MLLKKGDSTMINPAIINAFAEGAAPRVLVVTDLSFTKEGNGGFSLARFIETLVEGEVLGRKARVTKASLLPEGSDPESDILGFTFDKLLRSEYDVCFIFAIRPDGSLAPEEIDAIARFMEEGGGVFATGDHEDLGARTAKDIPRVSSMRKWFWDPADPNNFENAPSIAGINRLSTNLPGDDELYEFDDQSDRHLQRLYLNRRTEAGGDVDMPHPLMQARGSDGRIKAIVHIPDHPHEGQCVIPSAEALQNKEEWPLELGSNETVSPEIVAKSMSHGGGFSGKEHLIPREFIAIAAYDGHRAGVGRVVTDATWHHFIDINIDGTGSLDNSGSSRTALMPADDEIVPDIERQRIAIQLKRLQQHWRNLAEWLMPPQARRRHAAVVNIADAVKSIPLDVLISLSSDLLDDLGGLIQTNLGRKLLPYQVNDLVNTVLAMGISDPTARKSVTPEQIATALGAFAVALSKQTADADDEEILANLAEAVRVELQP